MDSSMMCNDQLKQIKQFNMSQLLINLTQLELSLAQLSPSLFVFNIGTAQKQSQHNNKTTKTSNRWEPPPKELNTAW